MIQSVITFSLFLLTCLTADGTNYTVKSGGGGSFMTVSGCSGVAVAGDTCTIFSGSYAGWTQSASGSAGNLITFTANTGDTVTITSGVTVSSQSYIAITFLVMHGTITGNGSTSHLLIDHCTANTTLFHISDGLGSNGSDNVISNNVLDLTGVVTNAEGFYVYGDRNRFESNEIKNTEGDCFDLGGQNVVVRGNYCHDRNGASGEHLDFVQVIGGGTSPTLAFSLIERNVVTNCTADSGNCHGYAIIRTGSGPVADTNIIRYNYAANIDGDCINFGGSGDNVPNNSAYNNTCASGHLATYDSSFDSVQGTTTNTNVLNNIAYNVEAGSGGVCPCFPFGATSPGIENGNVAFTTGFSGSWPSPYSAEGTYAALHNQDPKFANYPTDGTLQASSPAIGAGVALTTVAAGDSGSGTSLVVTNTHVFQPGWAGAQADWLRVGTSTTVQIASINYSTNTITLANSISRSTGDPVYLYRDSSGVQVLFGSLPDVGAYPYIQSTSSIRGICGPGLEILCR